jgi:hypothetical protein
MAHYAFIDSNNMVIEVIVGKDESDTTMDWEQHYTEFRLGQTCKRTSYNTLRGQHLLGGTPFRKNYAGIGYTYDQARDAFIPPTPFASWILNEDTCNWESPVPRPEVEGKRFIWNEATTSWDEFVPSSAT